jgi:hypothetical protein
VDVSLLDASGGRTCARHIYHSRSCLCRLHTNQRLSTHLATPLHQTPTRISPSAAANSVRRQTPYSRQTHRVFQASVKSTPTSQRVAIASSLSKGSWATSNSQTNCHKEAHSLHTATTECAKHNKPQCSKSKARSGVSSPHSIFTIRCWQLLPCSQIL